MSLPTTYLTSLKNLEKILNSIKTARAPERFSAHFLENLGFDSSTDRLYIGVLKGLGFLTDDAVPTERYFAFLDQSRSGAVLAEGIREAYADIFSINTKANEMPLDDVRNKFRTLIRGEKSEKVVSLMASTFRELCALADWDSQLQTAFTVTPVIEVEASPQITSDPAATSISTKPMVTSVPLHYNIQIHLPDSRDPAVYEAIFQALRKHLI